MGAPQARIELLARALRSQGLEVLVHTGFPNYPSGKLLNGYRNRPWLRERTGDVEVLRSTVHPAPNRGFARRLLNHASFAASALATAPLSGSADVVVAETPPLFLAAASSLYARSKRASLILHVADRWPASAVELGALRSGSAIRAASALERFSYRHARLIVAPTEGLVEVLGELPEASGRCRRVWPTVDLARFSCVPAVQTGGQGRPLRVVYAGTVGMAQGLGTLVEAARLAGPEVVHVSVAGDGAEWAAVAERARGLGNIHLIGAVRREQVPGLLADADVAAVLLRDMPLFRSALPTKLLEAMAAGRPVVLSAPPGEAESLARETEAGLVVSPENPRALARAFAELQRDRGLQARLGAGGRRFAASHLDVAGSAQRWSELIKEASTPRSPVRIAQA